jgi:hypothetical protein
MNIVNLDFPVFEESPASPAENASFDGSRVSRSLWFPDATPAKRYAFQKALMGYAKVLPDNGRRYLHRQIPYGNPAVSDGDLNPGGSEYLWCKSVPSGTPVPSIPSADPATGVATYKGYRWSCEFRSCPYRVCADEDTLLLAQAGPLAAGPGLNALPDEGDALRRGFVNTRYVSNPTEQATKINQIKQASLNYLHDDNSPGPLVGHPMPLPQYMETILWRWFEVPEDAVPRKAIADCANNVNDATFAGYPAGTLILRSASRRPYNNPLGPGMMYDIEYKMEYLPNQEKRLTNVGGVLVHRQLGWNSDVVTIRPADGGNGFDFYRVGDDDGNPPHAYKDFSSLFRPDQS